MRRALFVLALIAVLPGVTAAASYKDRSVDGKRYLGTCSNGTYGTYRNVEIEFRGDRATVHFSTGRLLLVLDDEHITDPDDIGAYDARRGIRWDLTVRGLDSQ
jgi:hypothetical protein